VETDQGEGYLKAIGNPGGEHCIACEYVGTQLARWFCLPTFDFALVNVSDVDMLPFSKGGNAKPGPAFITRKERGQPWGGSERELKKLINPNDLTRLVIFDTLTLNWDRYSIDAPGKRRINRDNVFLSQEGPPGKLVLKAYMAYFLLSTHFSRKRLPSAPSSGCKNSQSQRPKPSSAVSPRNGMSATGRESHLSSFSFSVRRSCRGL
jgi:hypothetical protein